MQGRRGAEIGERGSSAPAPAAGPPAFFPWCAALALKPGAMRDLPLLRVFPLLSLPSCVRVSASLQCGYSWLAIAVASSNP